MAVAVSIENSSLIIGALIAFVGGLLSFASPCVLPLVPGYIGYLAGTTVNADAARARRGLLMHGLAFVLGFSTVFSVFGVAVGLFLTNVQAAQGYVRWVGGVVVIILGMHTMGLIHIPFLNRTVKMQPTALMKPRRDPRTLGIVANPQPVPDESAATAGPAGSTILSLGRSALVGVFFAAGWSPCIGPILTGIYGVVGAQPANGGALLFIYSLGLGVPFLLVALLFSRASALLRRVNRYYGVISLVSGVFLIAIGILLLTNTLARLSVYAPAISIPGLT